MIFINWNVIYSGHLSQLVFDTRSQRNVLYTVTGFVILQKNFSSRRLKKSIHYINFLNIHLLKKLKQFDIT